MFVCLFPLSSLLLPCLSPSFSSFHTLRTALQPDAGDDHEHDSTVTSVGIEAEGALDGAKLNEWLSTLLMEKGNDLFRSKGILSIAGSDDKCVWDALCRNFGSDTGGRC